MMKCSFFFGLFVWVFFCQILSNKDRSYLTQQSVLESKIAKIHKYYETKNHGKMRQYIYKVLLF